MIVNERFYHNPSHGYQTKSCYINPEYIADIHEVWEEYPHYCVIYMKDGRSVTVSNEFKKIMEMVKNDSGISGQNA